MTQLAYYYPEGGELLLQEFEQSNKFQITRISDLQHLTNYCLTQKKALLFLMTPKLSPQLKALIQGLREQIHIVHIGHPDGSLEAWRLHLFHFIPLPFTMGDFKDACSFYLKSTNQLDAKFSYSDSNGVHSLDINKILYLRAEGNYTRIALSNQKAITITKQLGLIEEELSSYSEFVRVNRSWIFNFSHIKSLSKEKVTLSNGYETEITNNMHKLIRSILLKKSMI